MNNHIRCQGVIPPIHSMNLSFREFNLGNFRLDYNLIDFDRIPEMHVFKNFSYSELCSVAIRLHNLIISLKFPSASYFCISVFSGLGQNID